MATRNECMNLVRSHMLRMPVSMVGNRSSWKADHMAAWCVGVAMPKSTPASRITESSMVHLITGLAQMCDAHFAMFDCPIGENGYAEPYVTDIAKALLAMLNHDTGRLDCATLDRLIRDIAKAAGLEGVEQ